MSYMHHFDIRIAEEYGVEQAIMIHNLDHWLSLNKANRRNIHEGKVWTYNSVRALAEWYSYWSEQQVRRIMKKLEDEGVVEAGRFNKVPYDQTKWYTFTEAFVQSHRSICRFEQIESGDSTNQSVENDEPIPDGNADGDADGDTDKGAAVAARVSDGRKAFVAECRKRLSKRGDIEFPEEFGEAWAAYPRKTSKKAAFKAWVQQIEAGIDPGDLVTAAKNYAKERKGEPEKFTKHAGTFYGPDDHWRDFLTAAKGSTGNIRHGNFGGPSQRDFEDALRWANAFEEG